MHIDSQLVSGFADLQVRFFYYNRRIPFDVIVLSTFC